MRKEAWAAGPEMFPGFVQLRGSHSSDCVLQELEEEMTFSGVFLR